MSVLHQKVSREETGLQEAIYSDRGITCGGVNPRVGICSLILTDSACSKTSRLFKSSAAFRISFAAIRICHHPISHSSILYSDYSIAQISETLGYTSQSYFGKLFRAETEMTPKEYRRRNHSPEFYTNF